MKKQIDSLVKLQEMDRNLDRLRSQIPQDTKRIRGIEKEVHLFEKEVEADKRRIQDLKKTQRQYEADIEDYIAHIRKSRGRLMSIKNNREYRALLREIEETEKGTAGTEDKLLGCLEELEELNKELETKKKALLAMGERLESEKTATAIELARVQEELSDIERSKKELIETIDSKLLEKYERIKATSGGIAVALVDNATCSECHMGIPPQMYNELQRQDTLEFCPNCQRIIYWKRTEAAA